MGLAGELVTSTTDAALGGATRTPIYLIEHSCLKEPLSLFFKLYGFITGIPDFFGGIPIIGGFLEPIMNIILAITIIVLFVLIGFVLSPTVMVRKLEFDFSSFFKPHTQGVANAVSSFMESHSDKFEPLLGGLYAAMFFILLLTFFGKISFMTAGSLLFVLGAIEGASMLPIVGINTMYALGYGLFGAIWAVQPIGFIFYGARALFCFLPVTPTLGGGIGGTIGKIAIGIPVFVLITFISLSTFLGFFSSFWSFPELLYKWFQIFFDIFVNEVSCGIMYSKMPGFPI